MASSNETGHAINVANFDTLISTASAFGTAYNPSGQSITLAAMQALSTRAHTAMNALKAVQPLYSNAVADRELAFAPLSQLVTRITNALKASGASKPVRANALTITRKLQGKRATPKLTDEQKAALTAEGKETKEISASQLSFDNRLDNFGQLVKLLASIPEYAPNETDLKIESLNAVLTDLGAKNNAVLTSSIPLNNARIARNEILYKTDTGLVDIAMTAKAYLKSVFGASSPQYKMVAGLKFVAFK
jgi:hypothetical protein